VSARRSRERAQESRSLRKDLETLRAVAGYRPSLLTGIVLLNVLVAVSEGLGLGLLIPVIEQVQSQGPVPRQGITGTVATAYDAVGVPFTLETTVLGIGLVMTARYVLDFLANWLTVRFQTEYVEELKVAAFGDAVDATVGYHDAHGSDEVLDVVLTKVDYADSVVESLINAVERALLCGMYVVVAVVLAPVLTAVLFAGSVLVILLLRRGVEPGHELGGRIADADRRIYQVAQGGVQGIRDVKSYGMSDRVIDDFRTAVREYTRTSVTLGRNSAAMNGVYQLLVVVAVLGVIYASATVASLRLSSFGVFLFAIYRLVPQLNSLNSHLYDLGANLPHLHRAFAAMADLEAHGEPETGEADLAGPLERIAFEDVSFAYEETAVLEDVSFEVHRGESIAFVGPSGAGKSTVVSLLARMYEPDAGTVSANGTPIDRLGLDDWRERVAVVRQSPYVFDRDLRFNLTLGAEVPEADLERVCRVTRVSEFLDRLPDGLDTRLGENGVRLSGGQRQRVALARALLADADVLVLDEATSEMDALLERAVFEGIGAMDREGITVAIAHRLSTVTDADRIYTMADGRVVEVGPHEELVDNGGTYATLYASQSSAPPE
jgi:subfamily B ATP-binding cassette protein MsbA